MKAVQINQASPLVIRCTHGWESEQQLERTVHRKVTDTSYEIDMQFRGVSDFGPDPHDQLPL